MNSIILIGRPTGAPTISYTPSQMAIAKFSLAVDRQKQKDKEDGTDFIRIVAFGKTAENCGKFLVKGNRTAVQGRIQTGSYKDKDGKTVWTTDVIADRVEFLEWPDRGEEKPKPRKPVEIDDEPYGFQALDADRNHLEEKQNAQRSARKHGRSGRTSSGLPKRKNGMRRRPMKLINADALIAALESFSDRAHGNQHYLNGIETAKELIAEADEAVVRCKDCKHSVMNDELGLLMCHYRKCYHLVPEDGFCNFGERITAESE